MASLASATAQCRHGSAKLWRLTDRRTLELVEDLGRNVFDVLAAPSSSEADLKIYTAGQVLKQWTIAKLPEGTTASRVLSKVSPTNRRFFFETGSP